MPDMPTMRDRIGRAPPVGPGATQHKCLRGVIGEEPELRELVGGVHGLHETPVCCSCKTCNPCKAWAADRAGAAYQAGAKTIGDACVHTQAGRPTASNRPLAPMLHTLLRRNFVWSMWNVWSMTVRSARRRPPAGPRDRSGSRRGHGGRTEPAPTAVTWRQATILERPRLRGAERRWDSTMVHNHRPFRPSGPARTFIRPGPIEAMCSRQPAGLAGFGSLAASPGRFRRFSEPGQIRPAGPDSLAKNGHEVPRGAINRP
jgi:hypothetical protein